MAKTPFGYSAITAKCRAKSAKLLTYADYEALSGMKSLSEAAAYLSERGDYGDEISGVSLSGISRSRLEELLNKALRRVCEELLLFSGGELRSLISGIMKKYEMISILKKAREQALLNDGEDSVKGCAAEDFRASFKGTEYYKAVSDCIDGAKIDYVRLETALYTMYYEKLLETARELGDGAVLEITKKTVDLRNIDVIIRARHSFGLSAESVYPYLLGAEGGISKKELMRLCFAEKNELFSLLTRHFGITFDAENYYSANHRNRFLYEYYRKVFAESPPSFGVVFAFIGLCEVEVTNLVHVIEGLRYKLPPEKILEFVASGR